MDSTRRQEETVSFFYVIMVNYINDSIVLNHRFVLFRGNFLF